MAAHGMCKHCGRDATDKERGICGFCKAIEDNREMRTEISELKAERKALIATMKELLDSLLKLGGGSAMSQIHVSLMQLLLQEDTKAHEELFRHVVEKRAESVIEQCDDPEFDLRGKMRDYANRRAAFFAETKVERLERQLEAAKERLGMLKED